MAIHATRTLQSTLRPPERTPCNLKDVSSLWNKATYACEKTQQKSCIEKLDLRTGRLSVKEVTLRNHIFLFLQSCGHWPEWIYCSYRLREAQDLCWVNISCIHNFCSFLLHVFVSPKVGSFVTTCHRYVSSISPMHVILSYAPINCPTNCPRTDRERVAGSAGPRVFKIDLQQ